MTESDRDKLLQPVFQLVFPLTSFVPTFGLMFPGVPVCSLVYDLRKIAEQVHSQRNYNEGDPLGRAYLRRIFIRILKAGEHKTYIRGGYS
jgi:hypothetical protein